MSETINAPTPDPESLDLSSPRRLHIIGLGGAGMSAIATVLVGRGHAVSGSDLKESRALERLRSLGVEAFVGHDATHVAADLDAVIISTAVPQTNPEVLAAREAGVAVLDRASALAALVARHRGIAVAGSHGKTTTSSMLALVLRAAHWQPSFVIGGDLNEVGSNAAADDGEWIVVEADESDGTFLRLDPEVALVTNIEPDHLDHYGGFDALIEAFTSFLDRVPGLTVVGIDTPVAAQVASVTPGVVTYGTHDHADYRMIDYRGGRSGCSFEVVHHGTTIGMIEMAVPGHHNAENALGAAVCAIELGIEFDVVAAALGRFAGVARRFQFRGERDGVTYVDDYAHLPAEVDAALRTAAEGGWGQVIAVFQPHRYSRTAALWRDFADAFGHADHVVLTDVYGAGEAPRPGVSGRLVLGALLDAHPHTPVTYLPRLAEVRRHVPHFARSGDLVITLGAGDLGAVADDWLAPR